MAARDLTVDVGVAVLAAWAGRAADQVADGAELRGCGGGGMRGDGADASHRSAAVERGGAERGGEIFLSLVSANVNREFHSRRHADDGQLLPEVPPGQFQRLVSQRASF